MNRQIICISCPRGCRMTADTVTGELSGNACPKGIDYGRQEILEPRRMLTTTVRTVDPEQPRLPVRLDSDIPLAEIFDYMEAVNGYTLRHSCRPGERLIEHVVAGGAGLLAAGEFAYEG